jgi:outer membrane protein TolC
MKNAFSRTAIASLAAMGFWTIALAADPTPGASVESFLSLAREQNPELASMRLEARAAGERVAPAGALPDPKFRVELMDITKMGEQDPTLLPANVGSTRYTFMQDIPWLGKRDLKRDIAALEAEAASGRARGTWSELAARIKANFAQFYYLHQSERLTQEILDLMRRLELVAQARYASGLVPQQDVVRAQVEQSNMRNELIALKNEQRMAQARLNALIARPADAPLEMPQVLRSLPSASQMEFSVLESRAREHNPLIFAQNSQFKAAQSARELTYKNRYPDWTVGITPVQYGNAIKEWSLMVELNIPLQQSSRRSQEREAEAMLSAAETRKQAVANQVLSELAENLSALDAARQTELTTTASLLPLAELASKSAMASYETGKVDFATLLDAQKQIRQAKQTQIKAQVEARLRLAEIEKLLGEDL